MIRKRLSIVLFGSNIKYEKIGYVELLLKRLQEVKINIFFEKKFKDFLSNYIDYIENFEIFKMNEHYDIIISLGGDGTFLKTVSRIYPFFFKTPILGVNMGSLGFLADVSPNDIEYAIESLYSENYKVEKRNLLEVNILSKKDKHTFFALNEVALLKVDNSSLINIAVEIDSQPLTNYVADGLIICTPTGSTGYSLSVNGPIISPDSNLFCLSAVAPHSLNVRPVVINDTSQLFIKVSSRTKKFLLSVDGRSYIYNEEVRIELKKALDPIYVIKIIHQNFYDTLREKLNWGMDLR